MIPANNNRQHRRHPQPCIVLPKIPKLAVLCGNGHGWEIMFVSDRLEVAAEEEEVCCGACACVRGEDGAVD